ncbi:MAG: hypothetical protein ABW171_12980, partial [Steroidobacter sp.]
MYGRVRRLAVAIALTFSQTIVAAQALAVIAQPIPAQPVDSALTEFSRQTGLQIVYMSRVADRVKSSAVPSGLPSEEALRRLLADTGLEFEFLDRRTVTILPTNKAAPKSSRGSPQSATERRDAGYIRLAQVEPGPITRVPPQVRSLHQAEGSEGGSSLEEVVVTGIRNSLRESLQSKREAASVLDVITSEDIGKFPD